MSFSDLRGLLLKLGELPVDGSLGQTMFGKVCLQNWAIIRQGDADFAAVFTILESIKIAIIQRVPNNRMRSQYDRLVSRVEGIINLQNFLFSAQEVLASNHAVLKILNEDLEMLDEVFALSIDRMSDIETVLVELRDIQSQVFRSTELDDRFKLIVGGTLELCERAAGNIGKFGIERFREEVGCAYGRLSLELKNPTNTETAVELGTKVADAVLRLTGLAELTGVLPGLITHTPLAGLLAAPVA